MTVRELIAALEKIDPLLPVVLRYPDWPYRELMHDCVPSVADFVTDDDYQLHEARYKPDDPAFRACVLEAW